MARHELRGRRVLITGAARGLGLGMARAFGRKGARLVLWDVDGPLLDQAAAELAASGIDVRADRVDLTDPAAIERAASAVLTESGPVDVLVNNAGIVSGKPLTELTDREIARTFEVNTLALFRTTKAFLPAMIAQGGGHVVTIASAGGLVGTARLTDYCSSKFAAVGFDESLRIEMKRLGHPIRTTVVCPLYVSTGMFDGVTTRFSWLLPILDPEKVVRRTVNAVERGYSRVLLPWFVYVGFPLRLIPMRVFDSLMDFFGMSGSMDRFRGRTGPA